MAFITQNIQSIGEVEILRLLFADKEKSWSSQEIRREMQSSHQSIGQHLENLVKLGLIAVSNEEPSRYHCNPRNPQLDQSIQDLLAAFAVYPVRVIEAIYNRPDEGLRDFSNAFKIRKGD